MKSNETATGRLVTVVQELSLARDLPSIMEIVRHAARAVTGADGATFVLRDGDCCYYAEEDAISPLWKGQRFPMTACISGWAMLHGKSTVIADIYADSRIPADAYRPTFVKSLAMVPIRTAAPIGAIGAYWASPHNCTSDELMLLEALANTTAVAMENVQVYAELERRVQARTQQLEAANRELEAFSFAVSHDLRSPLRGISLQLGRLLEGEAGALQESSLSAIRSALDHARQMGTLIDDLLRLSRISRQDLKLAQFDLSALATEIVDRLRAAQPQRDVDVRIEPGVLVEADAGLVAVAMENLLSNAWKYSSNVARALIEFGVQVDAGGRRVYHVSDNGAGFDPRYAHRLFQPFQRLHRQEEFSGTGVGLATVHRIVSHHGGELSAQSSPGRGATFSFTLGEPPNPAALAGAMPDGPLDG